MSDHGLFTISDPDENGNVTLKYKLKPYFEHKFKSRDEAVMWVYGYWTGYYQKIEDSKLVKT